MLIFLALILHAILISEFAWFQITNSLPLLLRLLVLATFVVLLAWKVIWPLMRESSLEQSKLAATKSLEYVYLSTKVERLALRLG